MKNISGLLKKCLPSTKHGKCRKMELDTDKVYTVYLCVLVYLMYKSNSILS